MYGAFVAHKSKNSFTCRNGAWGSGSAKRYLYPSLLKGWSSGYP